MHAGELLLILIFNGIVIFVLYYFQKRLIEKNIKHLKEEIHELEDLVAAIIEEFEDIAEINTDKTQADEKSGSNHELSMSLNYPTVGDFLDNLAEDDLNKPIQAVEDSRMPLAQVDNANGTMISTIADSLDEDDEVDAPVGELNRNRTVSLRTDVTVAQEMDGAISEESSRGSKPETPMKLESINDPRHRRILELRQQGITVEEIARQLKTGRGEIQLVLGLYRRS